MKLRRISAGYYVTKDERFSIIKYEDQLGTTWQIAAKAKEDYFPTKRYGPVRYANEDTLADARAFLEGTVYA